LQRIGLGDDPGERRVPRQVRADGAAIPFRIITPNDELDRYDGLAFPGPEVILHDVSGESRRRLLVEEIGPPNLSLQRVA
jgi:hypothetical protein